MQGTYKALANKDANMVHCESVAQQNLVNVHMLTNITLYKTKSP